MQALKEYRREYQFTQNVLKSAVSQIVAANDQSPLAISSNVARDILKRARGFNKNTDAVFEYIANAYESYDQGQFPMVFCTVEKNKITITDHGVGMTLENFRRLWCMHGETRRRPNGLNRRGYNGTGKIAGLRCAERLTISTVHNGLRHVATLSLSEVNKAAKEERMPELLDVACNMATTARNGTTITLEGAEKDEFPNGFNAEFIRELRAKIASEKMMWMKMGDIYVNGTPVEAIDVPFDSQETVRSSCGNFVAELYFLDRGYHDELQDVHIKIGGVFVASEQFGKEGHRLASRVYALCDTTSSWSERHFEGQRENFVSESRDLRFKAATPAGRAYKKFITTAIADYLKKWRRKTMNDVGPWWMNKPVCWKDVFRIFCRHCMVA